MRMEYLFEQVCVCAPPPPPVKAGVSPVSSFWETGHGAVTFSVCVTCADSVDVFHVPQLQV